MKFENLISSILSRLSNTRNGVDVMSTARYNNLILMLLLIIRILKRASHVRTCAFSSLNHQSVNDLCWQLTESMQNIVLSSTAFHNMWLLKTPKWIYFSTFRITSIKNLFLGLYLTDTPITYIHIYTHTQTQIQQCLSS